MTTPRATYRLQLTPELGLGEAREHLGYLRELGASHLYLSPIFESRPGSPHGYDVTDPTRVRGELGGRDAFESLADAARDAGLGIVLDIVPNHMAAHHANPWWWRTLRDGPTCEEARIFDIDWEAGGGRVVLPVLGDTPERVLERGELRIDVTPSGERAIRYFDDLFPLRAALGGEARGAAELGALLARQHYELIHWREGASRRNYRRFFDIDHLAGVRIEDPEVFERTHRLVADLWRDGRIDGVRVDHVDGLARPGEYLRRLRSLLPARRGEEAYVVVEKILARHEPLPDSWPVEGTTGYDALNEITRLFVSREGFEAMRRASRDAGAADVPFRTHVDEATRVVHTPLFPGALGALAARAATLLDEPDAGDPLTAPIREIAVALPVYRTYLADGLGDADRQRLEGALERARAEADARAVDAIGRLLLAEGRRSDARQAFIQRFEQLTGPAMAKGLEDTAHYRHAVLAALNEVGGEPEPVDADPVAAFHEAASARAGRWPRSMVALSTHDTKRGEDARARLLALADGANAWGALLAGAAPLAADAEPSIAPEDLVLLLQAAIAIWPETDEPGDDVAERLAGYMTKSLREGKLRSSWLDPDEAYEAQLEAAVRRLVREPEGAALRASVRSLVDGLLERAAQITHAQTVLRMTVPGVPDTYQGSEWEALTLVDPDNRRPVDLAAFARSLGRLRSRALPDTSGWREAKLLITRRLHALREEMAPAFDAGAYRPLETDDPGVVCFARGDEPHRVVVAAPVRADSAAGERLTIRGLAGAWRDELGGRTFHAGDDLLIDRPWAVVAGIVLVSS